VVFGLVLVTWAAGLRRAGRGLGTELADPVYGPFVGLVPAVGSLLGAALVPVAEQPGRVVVDVFAVATVLLGGWLTGCWYFGDLDRDAVHGGYYLPTVAAGFVSCYALVVAGQPDPARLQFGLGALSWLLVGSVIMQRFMAGPALPPALRPTMAINLAPPVVGGNAWFALTAGQPDDLTYALAGFALLLLVVEARGFATYRSLPFTPGFWSFTFVSAATATFALHWLAIGSPPGAGALTWSALALVTGLIGAIAAVSLARLARGDFLAPAAAAPIPAHPPTDHGGETR
jgi:tellurite resistance protein